MSERRFYPEIFLVSMAVILLEIGYTRVFSYKLFYYFTYLIIGIALLGLGAGGVFVAIFPRLRQAALARLIPTCCALASAAVLIGYFVVAKTQLNAFHLSYSGAEIAKLTLICSFLYTPFLLVGIVVTRILSAHPADINKLYGVDLLGASLGCAVCVPLLSVLTPPGTVWLSGAVLALASLPLAISHNRGALLVSLPVGLVLLVGSLVPAWLPEPIPDSQKTMSPQGLKGHKVLFSSWSPVFRIDVMEYPPLHGATHVINHDGMMGSTLQRFNGDLNTLRRFETDQRQYPYRIIGKKDPKVLIIGAAGGHEVLAGLYYGASHVTGVELNPVTYSLLTTHFADWTGHLPEHERVTLINAEGRSFLGRDQSKYDLILFVAPDSYSAMNAATSGAFVLSESYLYTTEMVIESLEHLADGGVVCMDFGELDFDNKPNRTVRYLSTAREAFRRLGVTDFKSHVLLSTSPGMLLDSTILLKRTPFTAEEVNRFLNATKNVKGSIVRFAGQPAADSAAPIKAITLPEQELAEWHARYPYDVRAVTDDSPFFWHFARFADAVMRAGEFKVPGFDIEDATGERVLLVLLAFVIVFAAVFLFLPFVAIRHTWQAIPYKLPAGIYFAALGMGFMFFEISLIQKLTLFLGYPTYSLTVTLFGLLISTGCGSLLSERYTEQRDRALTILFVAIVLLTLFHRFAMEPVVAELVGASLAVRIMVALAFLAPLGLCLGCFMPLGLRTIAMTTPYSQEYVAWGWAVNGFFSVISSILATILSMTVGFKLMQLIAVGVYAVGIIALRRIPQRV